MNKMRWLFAFLFSFSVVAAFSQDRPIGYWRAHMPYSNTIGAATDGVTFYAISKESFFTYNVAQDEITPYSKVDGMADVQMAAIAYDATTDIAILGYANTNIDLFTDGTFYNIPDIKLKSLSGIKQINQIVADNGMAYIATSFGVVVIDLMKKEVKETYSFINNNQSIPVTSFTADSTYFYAATTNGLYRANKNQQNLQAFSAWQKIDNHTGFINLLSYNNAIYINDTDTAFIWKNNALQPFYKSNFEITLLSATKSGLYVNEYRPTAYRGKIKHIDNNGNVLDSFNTEGKPVGIYQLSSGNDLYEADAFYGLTKYTNNNYQWVILPQGPSGYGAYDILANNKNLWIAHGGYDRQWRYVYNQDGFSKYQEGKWSFYTFRNTTLLNDHNTDFIRVAEDPVSHQVYLGSYRGGLYRYNTDGSLEDLTKTTPALEGTVGDTSAYRISGLVFDDENNLWITQYGATHELVVRTKEGNYYNFSGYGSRQSAASVIIDDYNQKWYLTPGLGVAVYNDNHSIDNTNDDGYARMDMSSGMPSNNTYSIAKDKDGTIWVGTDNGIGIINCPNEAISGTCAVEKRIVQYDKFAGYLFQGEAVMSIAVDGGNRKWIGTTNGVWLVSPSADKIIYRFTVENSPLPSNTIQKITIDPVTGDVYIGTDLGLVSFRSTATEGTKSNTNVVIFPNPVPSGYDGTIAIKGLTTDGDVRITDVTGQLVYRTKALGGQAVWNGKDYTGNKPQSGVYLIFVTNTDGTETYCGKLVFLH
jgi:ligand-binding sensor domain-containing protein